MTESKLLITALIYLFKDYEQKTMECADKIVALLEPHTKHSKEDIKDHVSDMLWGETGDLEDLLNKLDIKEE